jgi:hypothetical protein
MTYYKVLHENGRSHIGSGTWSLPRDGKPGAWRKVAGPLVMCSNGLHACTSEQLIDFLDYGPECYEIEYRRTPKNDGSKVVGRKARLVRKIEGFNEKNLRLFACDCAERALKRERKAGREPDPRSWEAIRVSRLFARGRATDAAWGAARDAAWGAARDAAWAAARDAAWNAARDAAWGAARAAARDAAWDAATAAAWDAARDAEESWQTKQLLKRIGLA